MSVYRHGLVIGKFYPPTPGHEFLLRQALARCARVTVLVEYSRFETIPGEARARWLAEMLDTPRATVNAVACEAPVDYDDPLVWRTQMAVIEQALRGVERPDAVVVSERYGAELARRLGAALCAVDPGRETVPISATEVRRDLYASWHRLHPAVRAGLATRVVVVGAESTGTTTLARALAGHYRSLVPGFATRCVPEYGREYTLLQVGAQGVEDTDGFRAATWRDEDFVAISRRQHELEEAAARQGGPLLVCDTDELATAVWRRRYLGRYDPPATLPRHDLYLLTDHDGVPFVQDGIRDGEGLRAEMTGWFEDALAGLQLPWMLVSGTPSDRMRLATSMIDRILERNRTFGAPLG